MTEQNKYDQHIITALNESLVDNRRNRRLTLLFRLFLVVYLLITLYLSFFHNMNSSPDVINHDHLAIIEISGEISSKTNSADVLNPIITMAFENETAKAVVLSVDSPGGSAAQSDMIRSHIDKMKQKFKKPVISVVSDICASGCYYIASSADKIVVNHHSIVGSIGVRMGGFNFSEVMNRFGVQRSEVTAGEHKTMLDPFFPIDADAVDHLQKFVVQPTYDRFVSMVREGRGARLKGGDELFSGLVWSGEYLISIGLADEFGSLESVKDEFFPDSNEPISDIEMFYTKKKASLFGSLFTKFVSALGDSLIQSLKQELSSEQQHSWYPKMSMEY